MQNFLDDSEFLAAYFEGTLGAEDRSRFEEWLEAHPKASIEMQEHKLLWRASVKVLNPESTAASRWQGIEARLQSTPDASLPLNGQSWISMKQIKRIAAVFVAVLALGVLAFYISRVEHHSPSSSVSEVTLPDGSLVKLNAESSIKYNRLYWLWTRELQLEGEAFFEVKRNQKEFSVISDFITTTVLGTSFNIFNRESKVRVTCVSGQVEVHSQRGPDGALSIAKGEIVKAEISADGVHSMDFGRSYQVSEEARVPGWISGEFRFQETPLREVLDEMERQFSIKIKSDPTIDGKLFTGVLEKTSIESVLEIISISAGLDFSTESDNVFMLK